MSITGAPDGLHRMSAATALGEPESCRGLVEDVGALYVVGLDTDENLVRLGRALGLLVSLERLFPGSLHDGFVFRVQSRNAGCGVPDRHGRVIGSTTSNAFPFHTDGYHSPVPPRYLLMLRADTSDEDPDVAVSDARVARGLLSAACSARLSTTGFASGAGPQPILTDRWIRLDSERMGRWERGAPDEPGTTGEDTAAGRELAAAVHAASVRFKLGCGDAVVLDNWRMCHFRATLEPDSRRVVHRLWVDEAQVVKQ